MEYTAKDGKKIHVAVWDDVKDPKAVVQIVHGMAEHIGRYDEFARVLNAHGYIVLGDDHRAHGLTDADRLGKAEAGKDLFADTLTDLKGITDYAKATYGLPVIVFGHSYGSFLTQAYLLDYSDGIVACILSGSARQPNAGVNFGRFMANRKAKKHADDPGKLFASQTFEKYDKKIGEGTNAWLCRDKESNARFDADPLCGFVCSNGFYRYLFRGLTRLNRSDFTEVRADLPLFVIYGGEDYVGGCGKLAAKLVRKYEKAGLTVEEKKYEGARHELTNELNRAEVFDDVVDFCDSVISGEWQKIVEELSDGESEAE